MNPVSESRSRQVRRAELRSLHFARLDSTDNPYALGVPLRKERRKLARAYAAREWREETLKRVVEERAA